ncbi:40s ribosomal s8 [Fusarium heterosporum]|uniref:40s ribosomal s8 n=1 Tax=Fusarium heterosporum TaxID=42747 RepID=A0A8H5WUX2_FUSHE|nr:40s ribosomal s8 [Fusarium heterosporum]
MNPCAPTFVPTGTSEDELSEDEEVSRSSSMEARHSDQDLDSPESRFYDYMFPALSPPRAQQVDPRNIRSPRLVRRKKSKNPGSKKGNLQQATPPSDQRPNLNNQGSSNKNEGDGDGDGEDEEDGDEVVVEYLKPTVYTPSKSPETLKPTVYTPLASSHNTSGRPGILKGTRPADARARTRSPHYSWRPPTPHPDSRPRGSRGRRAPTPVVQTMPPTGYPFPVAYPPPFYNYYDLRSTYQVMQPHMHYAQHMVPPMMSFSPVPWHMPPAPWSVPEAPPQDFEGPLDFECYYEDSALAAFDTDGKLVYYAGSPIPPSYVYPDPPPRSQPQQRVQYHMPPQAGHGSFSSSQTSDPQGTSQGHSMKGRQPNKSSSFSCVVTAKGPTTSAPLKTQVEMIKDQDRTATSDRQLLGLACGKDVPKEVIEKDLRAAAEATKKTGFIPTRQAQSAQDSPGVAKSAKINLKRDAVLQEEKKTTDKNQTLTDPPRNAPTGPSSLRQLHQSFSATVKKTLQLAGSDSGAWSQSKRWTSFATKERQAFQKVMSNLRYMSADQSPFVPQTPAELTAFKAALAESKTKRLGQEVQQRLAKTNAKIADNDGETKVEPVMELLGGRKFEDYLSPFFAASNCFNDGQLHAPFGAEWPSLAELKEEGDKRSAQQGRCLPLPRMNVVAFRYSDQMSEACNADGSAQWNRKLVHVGSRYLCPVTPEDSSMIPAAELESDETPFILKSLLEDINTVGGDIDKATGEAEEKEEKQEGKKDTEKISEQKKPSK